MQPLWLVQQSLAGLTTYFALADSCAVASLVRNQSVVHAAAARGEPRVTPELAIDDASFDLDFFEDGITFASARLIEAMALPEGVVELGEIDDTACSEGIRRMRYRTLALRVTGDPIDCDASDGSVTTWIDGHGTIRSEWMLAAPQLNRPAPRVRWRSDFAPAADLILVDGMPWRVATDTLAARVAKVGATGIDFVDPIASAATGDLIRRIS